MELSRRSFLKLTIPATAVLALSGIHSHTAVASDSQSQTENNNRKAVLYDSSKCLGCRLCEAACRKKNNLPPESDPQYLSATTLSLIQSREIEANGKKKKAFLKRSCMHCSDASCVAVCPTGAAAHHGEFTEIDQDWCIGCGYCVESCPFNAVNREMPKGEVRKCTLCIDLVTKGSKPACVAGCPSGALTFGGRSDLLATAKTRVQTLVTTDWPEAQIYGENELGGLGQIYILIKPPSFYELPEIPKQATAGVLTQWTSGVVAAGVLAVPFWWIFKRKQNEKGPQTNQKEEIK